MYSELVSGEKSKVGQKKRFQDCINIRVVVINNMGIGNHWEIFAENNTDCENNM